MHPTHPPRLFNLEGRFLGFVGGSPRKPKSIIVEVEQEQLVIRLPKELRPYIRQSLQVGDRVQCVGKSQVDFEEGVIKLKAYQVFLPSIEERPAAVPAVPVVCTPQKRAKILVCHKSGCQKRGGRQLVEALEQTLQTYQIQDQVKICYTGCQKRCSKAPSLTLMPGKHQYSHLKPQDLVALIEEHFCVPEETPVP